MIHHPKEIKLNQIADCISDRFKDKDQITIYTGSNCASPTASLEALTSAVKCNSPKLPFIKMIHILMQGSIPYTEPGLQDRIMTYSIFSGAQVRKSANQVRAFYVPCTLATIDSLIGIDREYEPAV